MEGLRIKMIGPAWPFRGGLAAFNERLAREFIRMGHDVSLETFTTQYPSVLFPGKSQLSSSPSPVDLDIRRTVSSVNPFSWLKTGFRIRKEAPDVLIFRYWLPFMSPCFSIISRIVRRNKKTRILCLADNIVPHERRPGDQQLTSFFMQSIDGMVVMTQSVMDDAMQYRKNLSTELTPHPVFDNYGQPMERTQAIAQLGLAPEYRYLLFFGFIRDYKGLDWLLEAMSNPRVVELPVKLIVAGEFYTDQQPYLELIRRLKLEDRVILRSDYIPDDQVSAYFGASDLVVQPYKHATQSGVTQIAYHFGKPMLVTNVGGLPEMIPDQIVGYVVEPNVSAVKEAILDFFEHDRKSFFEKNMAQELEKYQWNKMVDAFVRLYDKIRLG